MYLNICAVHVYNIRMCGGISFIKTKRELTRYKKIEKLKYIQITNLKF